jgi:hypothetical protein
MNTKFNLLLLLISLILTPAYSQISQMIDIEKRYSGREYRLSGYINTAESGIIEFWAFQKDVGGNFVKDRYRRQTLPAENHWKKISFTGTFRKEANSLTFGIWCTTTIKEFYVDEIVLEIKDNGLWKTLNIANGGMEEGISDSTSLIPGWRLWAGYNAETDTLNRYSGETSLRLSQTELYQYGKFKEHGSSVLVNGVNIYYETYGEGEPLLLLHGNNQSIEDLLTTT